MRADRDEIKQRLSRAVSMVDGGRQAGDPDLLAAGIITLREIAAIPELNDGDQVMCFHLLSLAYEALYDLTADLGALKACVRYGDDALTLLPMGHSARADLLAQIGTHYRTLYEATSHLPFIESSIDRHRRAAAAFAPGSPDRGRCHANQARAHLVRYRSHHSNADDLRHAAELLQRALEDGLPDRRQQAYCLSDLTISLGWLYDHTRDPQCLATAITHGERAGALLGPEQRDANLSAALASVYFQRFRLTGEAADANSSITHEKAALSLFQ